MNKLLLFIVGVVSALLGGIAHWLCWARPAYGALEQERDDLEQERDDAIYRLEAARAEWADTFQNVSWLP